MSAIFNLRSLHFSAHGEAEDVFGKKKKDFSFTSCSFDHRRIAVALLLKAYSHLHAK